MLAYCGNLGEAHSQDFLIEVIKNINPQKHKLILAVYGSKSKVINEFIGDKIEGVELVEFVELSFIYIHLVSLLSKWINVSVPSKAMSAICSGGAFIFFGEEDCDTWFLLKESGWLIKESGNLESQVSNLFSSQITPKIIKEKKNNTVTLSKKLRELKIESLNRFGNKYFKNNTNN